MSFRRLITIAAVASAATSMDGCCGGEQHSVTIAAPDLLTVNVGSTTLLMYANTSLTSPPLASSTLEFIFDTLEGSTNGGGLVLTVRGSEATSSEALMLSLVLPSSLKDGDVYTVGRTFTNDPNFLGDAGVFGQYSLAQPGQAEVALAVSTYTFPPAHYEVNYRAATTTGTIQVTHRQRGQLELTLDLSFTDVTGKPAIVTGRVRATNVRNSATCS